MSGQAIIAGHSNIDGALPAQIDHYSRNLITMGPEHQMTHEGRHFILSHYFSDIDTDAYGRIRLKTKADIWIHAFFFAHSSAGLLFAVYEDTTFTHEAGNAITAISRNRTNLDEDSALDEACHTPGGSGSGVVISPTYIAGSGGGFLRLANPGEERDVNEYVLSPNTVYLIQAQSLSDNNRITIGMDYYTRDTNS